MKKFAVILVALAVLSFATSASAQDDEITFQAGIKGGWNFWIDEPLSDSVENNWIIGGELKIWFPNGFGIGGEVQWTTKDQEAEGFAGVNVDYTQVPINLDAYYRFPMDDSESAFYIGAGASFVFADITSSTTIGGTEFSLSADDTAFGFNGVAGFEYGMFFIEGQWLWAEATFEIIDIEVEDIQLGGPSFWVGVRF